MAKRREAGPAKSKGAAPKKKKAAARGAKKKATEASAPLATDRTEQGGERGGELAFPAGHPQAEEVTDALVRARAASTLVDLYDAWLRLRVARAAAAAERAKEAERLEVRAAYVLKSVESARRVGVVGDDAETTAESRALAGGDAFSEFQAAAQAELASARQVLADRSAREEAFFSAEVTALTAQIHSRVTQMAALQKPRVELRVQPLGKDHALVHLTRPGDEEALLLYFVLTGKLFTRYDAFFDDSVDDVVQGPARFYAEEGNDRARFDSVDAEDAVALDPARAFVPLKGMMALRVPGRDFPRFRIVNQGPLAEVQARTASGGYETLMPREAAELFLGFLIRLKVEGRLQVAMQIA